MDLADGFLSEIERTGQKDRTVGFDGVVYDVDCALIEQRVARASLPRCCPSQVSVCHTGKAIEPVPAATTVADCLEIGCVCCRRD